MNYTDAYTVAEELRSIVEPFCDPGRCLIGGSVRRQRHDVHDIEILCRPCPGIPVPRFGDKVIHRTFLDKKLYELEVAGILLRIKGKDKMKQYYVNLDHWGMQTLNGFKVEFYVCTPPAQWGVQCVIRTGPGSPEDNFSRLCVTQRSDGGYLPDGYRVKNLAVWHAEDIGPNGEPLPNRAYVQMPEEQDFLDFLGLGWVEPCERHARIRRQDHVTRPS